MKPDDDDLPERGRDDLLAAEYVLGVLDATQRDEASRRLDTDPAFARSVDGWEVSLAPLAAAYPSMEPPAHVKTGIDRRLAASVAGTAAPSGSWWSNLALWRGLAAGAAAALALTVALPYVNPPAAVVDTRYMAALGGEASDVRYAAMYDRADGTIALAHMSGVKAEDRDFELWMIEGSTSPVSMGVLPAGDVISIRLTPEVKAKLAAGAVLAISLEPLGGSPTGQPTGPVVASGDLKSI